MGKNYWMRILTVGLRFADHEILEHRMVGLSFLIF